MPDDRIKAKYTDNFIPCTLSDTPLEGRDRSIFLKSKEHLYAVNRKINLHTKTQVKSKRMEKANHTNTKIAILITK